MRRGIPFPQGFGICAAFRRRFPPRLSGLIHTIDRGAVSPPSAGTQCPMTTKPATDPTPKHIGKSILGSPLIWGTAVYLLFQWLLTTHLPGIEFLRRYTASHPIEHVETYLFFFGLTWLGLRFSNIASQRQRLARLRLPRRAPLDDVEQEARSVLEYLDRLPAVFQTDYVVERWKQVLQTMLRGDDSPEEHLVILNEQEAQRRYRDYGLLRLIVWAVPILGFLGTVVGIALALGNLSPSELEETLPLVMSGLTVAFDTTALALALSMILMLAQFLVQRWEDGLLDRITRRTEDEILQPFAVRKAGGSDNEAVRNALSRWNDAAAEWASHSVQVWEQSLQRVESDWRQSVRNAGESFRNELVAALEAGLRGFAQDLAQVQEANATQWQEEIRRRESLISAQLAQLEKLTIRVQEQTEAWISLSRSGSELRKLEEALQRNLTAIASAKHFEQALATLAAAASLLSAHLQRESAEDAFRSDVIRPTSEAA